MDPFGRERKIEVGHDENGDRIKWKGRYLRERGK